MINTTKRLQRRIFEGVHFFNGNTDLSAYSFDGRDELLRRFRDFICRLTAARQGSAGSDSDAAGFNPFTGIVDVNSTGRHERCLRQGAMDGFNGLHAYHFPREDLDDVCAAFKGCYDIFQGRRPRHDGYAVAVAQLDCFDVECRRYDEFCSFEDSNAGRDGVKNRAGTDDDVGIVGIFLASSRMAS